MLLTFFKGSNSFLGQIVARILIKNIGNAFKNADSLKFYKHLFKTLLGKHISGLWELQSQTFSKD